MTSPHQISSLLPFWLWFSLSIIFYALGEFLSKRWALTPSLGLTLAIVGSYALCGLFWIPLVQIKGSLALAGALWLIVATIVTITLGAVVFHEQLHKLQLVGLILGIVALALLELG